MVADQHDNDHALSCSLSLSCSLALSLSLVLVRTLTLNKLRYWHRCGSNFDRMCTIGTNFGLLSNHMLALVTWCTKSGMYPPCGTLSQSSLCMRSPTVLSFAHVSESSCGNRCACSCFPLVVVCNNRCSTGTHANATQCAACLVAWSTASLYLSRSTQLSTLIIANTHTWHVWNCVNVICAKKVCIESSAHVSAARLRVATLCFSFVGARAAVDSSCHSVLRDRLSTASGISCLYTKGRIGSVMFAIFRRSENPSLLV